MEKPNKDNMNAGYLANLINNEFESHQAGIYRNYFAIGCWLYANGQTIKADKIFSGLLKAINTDGHQAYLQELRDQMPTKALQFLSDISPNHELLGLSRSALVSGD